MLALLARIPALAAFVAGDPLPPGAHLFGRPILDLPRRESRFEQTQDATRREGEAMRDSCQRTLGIHHESGTFPGPHSTTTWLRGAVAVISAIVALGVIAAPALGNAGSVF